MFFRCSPFYIPDPGFFPKFTRATQSPRQLSISYFHEGSFWTRPISPTPTPDSKLQTGCFGLFWCTLLFWNTSSHQHPDPPWGVGFAQDPLSMMWILLFITYILSLIPHQNILPYFHHTYIIIFVTFSCSSCFLVAMFMYYGKYDEY